MSEVIFYADRLVRQEWDGDAKAYKELPVRIQELRSSVSIDAGVTLGQIFAQIAAHDEIKNAVAEYAWCGYIDEFHQAALEPHVEDGDEETKLVRLEVSAYGELTTYDGVTEFGIATNFIGFDAGGDHWSLSFSPMNTIAHLPVVINEEFTVRKDHSEEVFRAKRVFSLLEFLDAIYWDISFHGGPADTAKFAEELRASIAEIEAGTAKLIPLEDVFRDLEEEKET